MTLGPHPALFVHLALLFDCDATLNLCGNSCTPKITSIQHNNFINKAIVDVLRGLEGFPQTADPVPGKGPCHKGGQIKFSKAASLWLSERLIFFSALKFRQHEILLEYQESPFPKGDPRVKELKDLHAPGSRS